MNRKGAESFTVILWIVVGIVVVGLFIYAYYNGFLPFLSLTKNLPKPMQSAITVCEGVSMGGVTVAQSYCNQLRETESSSDLVTCAYLYEEKYIKNSIDCADNTGKSVDSKTLAPKLCVTEYKKTLPRVDQKLTINTVKCAGAVSCSELGEGIREANNEGKCVEANEQVVNLGKDKSGKEKICCSVQPIA